MSDATIQAVPAEHDVVLGGDVADYAALLKPRVMSLVVFTALVGLVAAPGTLHPVLAIAALACIAVGAAMASTGCRVPGAATKPTSAVNTTRDITRGFSRAA